MAGYGYKNMEYVAQEKSRPGTRIQPWVSSYDGVEQQSDQWRPNGFAATSEGRNFTTNYEGCRDHRCSPARIDAEGRKTANVAYTPVNHEGRQDHRCSPVSVDAEGRKTAIVACTPVDYEGRWRTPVSIDADGRKTTIVACTPVEKTKYIITTTETIVEHVPLVTTYTDVFPTRMEPTKDYGTINKEWSSPVNPSYERPPMVDEFFSKVQTEASRPTRMGPTKDYGTINKERSSPNPSRERPPTEASQPLKGIFWRRTPNSPNHDGTNGSIDTKDHYETVPNGKQEPAVITTGGWTRPNHVGCSTPPTYDSPLGKPTNDIGTAFENIVEAIKPPPAAKKSVPVHEAFATVGPGEGQMYTALPPPAAPRVKSSPKTAINSKEAAQRYKGVIM